MASCASVPHGSHSTPGDSPRRSLSGDAAACPVEEILCDSPRSPCSPSRVSKGNASRSSMMPDMAVEPPATTHPPVGSAVEAIRNSSRCGTPHLVAPLSPKQAQLLSIQVAGEAHEDDVIPLDADSAPGKLPRISVSSQRKGSRLCTPVMSPTNGVNMMQTLNSPKTLGPPVSPKAPISPSKYVARREAFGYTLSEFHFPPIEKPPSFSTQLMSILSFRRLQS